MLIVMEISFTTPPFGLLLFVMKGVAPASIRMGEVYRAAAPFVGLELLVLAALVAFPGIVHWLPAMTH